MSSLDLGRTIALPDLLTYCPFRLTINSNCDACSATTEAWTKSAGALCHKPLDAQVGLKCGLLASMCYPRAEPFELQVTCDFLNYLFHLDDLTDNLGTKDTTLVRNTVMDVLNRPDDWKSKIERSEAPAIASLTYDFWTRMTRTSVPNVQSRFIESMDFFFRGLHQQVKDRALGVIPGIEEYMAVRRDTGGLKSAFVLLQYAAHVDLPKAVLEHPIIQGLEEAANDVVALSNGRTILFDIFSYDREQAWGETHNIIVVVMKGEGLDLQAAVDFVGDMCKQIIDRFVEDRAKLPTWGERVDQDVASYMDGLEDWIVGNFYWSFETERYFGTNGKAVMAKRALTLRPARVPDCV